jgi:hypothetical protein
MVRASSYAVEHGHGAPLKEQVQRALTRLLRVYRLLPRWIAAQRRADRWLAAWLP